MKVYEIVYRNYLVGSDVLERTVTVKGWIRKCITLSDLERNKKIVVTVSMIVI
jgi:hypothetical protein